MLKDCCWAPLITKAVNVYYTGLPGGAVGENPPANAGDTGLTPGWGRAHKLQSH